MKRSNQTSTRSLQLSLLALGLAGVAILLTFLTDGATESATPQSERMGTGKKVKPRNTVSLEPAQSPKKEGDRTAIEGQSSEMENIRRELAAAKVELARISKPLREDILSSTVNAEIREGETLVTGGYMTADGNHELTLLTPKSVILEDGRQGVEVEAHVLSVGTEFTKAHGLEKLVTNARNTLQHAEAWTQPGATETLAAATAADSGKADLFSLPNVITASAQPFTMSTGIYLFEGTFTRKPDGGFSIKSHIERSPKAEPGTESEPD